MLGAGEGQGHRAVLDVVIQCQKWYLGIRTPQLASSLLSESLHKEKNSQEAWDLGDEEGGFSENRELPGGPSFFPWLSPQGSGHNVSQEAVAIKRMLEMGAVKNLTYF